MGKSTWHKLVKYSIISSALDRDEAKCCSYDVVNDCILDLSSADVPSVYRDCTGSESCSKQVTWMQTTNRCANKYMTNTNYMCIEYYCYPSTLHLYFDTTL
ncbi:hypothetical protein DPMN_136567 [Dreissena polymorpha]|uniref:Uncharacterized protein n=1 Tax=Dreissena polymorpha TaxID=45954 RepID=A0A9D4G320_DREPO|nr:hypothetical protein DPMN_136567 [Dreissena polymorpha]